MAKKTTKSITGKIMQEPEMPLYVNPLKSPDDLFDLQDSLYKEIKPGSSMSLEVPYSTESTDDINNENIRRYQFNLKLKQEYEKAVQDAKNYQTKENPILKTTGFKDDGGVNYYDENMRSIFPKVEIAAPQPNPYEYMDYVKPTVQKATIRASKQEKAPRGADPKPTGQINMLNYNKDTRLWEQLQLENARVGLDDAGGLLTRRGAEGDSFASFSTTPMASVKWDDGKNSITGTQNIGYDGGQSFFKNVARNIAADTYNAFKDAAKNVKINDLNIYGGDNINRVKTWILANNEDNLSSQKLQELRQKAKTQDKPILLYKKKDKQGHTYYEVEAVKEVLFENTKKDGTILYTYYTIDDNGKPEKYDLPIEPTDKTRLDAHFGNKKYKPVLTAKYSTLVDVLTDMVQEASRNGKMKYNVSNNLAPDQRDKIHRAAGRIWGTAILRKLMGGD